MYKNLLIVFLLVLVGFLLVEVYGSESCVESEDLWDESTKYLIAYIDKGFEGFSVLSFDKDK